MRALVLEDQVAQVVADGQEFPVAPPLIWLECPDDCIAGWAYLDGQFSAPAPRKKTPEEELQEKLPTQVEKIDALWEFIGKNDRTKLDAVLVKESQAVLMD